jgi:transcriptional regulator with XRE-family HTH domain
MSARPAIPAPTADRVRLGQRLRESRKLKRLTLKDLSVRSGVALSTLSKMELGQTSVAYDKVAAVARALSLDVGQLFDTRARAPAGARAPTVVWSDAGAAPAYSSDTYEYRMLATDFPGKRMTPLHGRIVARKLDQFPDFIRHQGQEFVIVLAGRVRIHFETGETIELGRHESAYFDSGVGHVYLSLGRTEGQVLVVMSE